MPTQVEILWCIAGTAKDSRLLNIARTAQQLLAGYQKGVFAGGSLKNCVAYANRMTRKAKGPKLVVIITDGVLTSTDKTAVRSALNSLSSRAMILFIIAQATVEAALEFFDHLENEHPKAKQLGATVHHQDTGYATARHIIGELLEAYRHRHS